MRRENIPLFSLESSRPAREFDAIFVPLDGPFAAAATQREMGFWLPDGVHPTAPGHALIAQAWLKAVKA